MSYRVEVIVIDDAVPLVASDRPEVVMALSVSGSYRTLALVRRIAQRVASWGAANEKSLVEKV